MHHKHSPHIDSLECKTNTSRTIITQRYILSLFLPYFLSSFREIHRKFYCIFRLSESKNEIANASAQKEHLRWFSADTKVLRKNTDD